MPFVSGSSSCLLILKLPNQPIYSFKVINEGLHVVNAF